MFVPKWARRPHDLGRFPSWDPCITPGYWAWYLNALPTSGSLIRSLFYAFMPREGIYTCVFCPPSSPQRRKPGYAALLRIRGNYFRPYLSIPRVCHRGAAYQWKFSHNFARALRFPYISLPSLHDYNVKLPQFHVLSRTGTKDNNFLFLFLNFDAVL